MKRVIARVGALVLSSALGAVLTPGCFIRVGPGSGPDAEPTTAGSTGDSPGQGGAGAAPGPTPEEQETIDELNDAVQRADPLEVALLDLRSQYTAYGLAGTIDSQSLDPSTIDEATLQQLVDQYAPELWNQAAVWTQSLDPSTLELATLRPKEECVDKWDFGCKRNQYCDFNDDKTYGSCVVTSCGEGKCPSCPDLWDLSKLFVKGWCVYSCVRNHSIVGIKVIFHVALNGKVQHCFLLEHPIPLE